MALAGSTATAQGAEDSTSGEAARNRKPLERRRPNEAGFDPRHRSSEQPLIFPLNSHDCALMIIVFPEAKNNPPRLLKRNRLALVSLSVLLNLRQPIVRVGLWYSLVLGAAMPEAPVNKYCEPSSGECNIRPSLDLFQPDQKVNPKPKASSVEQPSNLDLRQRIAAAISTHIGAPRCGQRLCGLGQRASDPHPRLDPNLLPAPWGCGARNQFAGQT